MTSLILGGLIILLIQGTLAFQGRDKNDQWNRVGWLVMTALMFEAMLIPNLFMGLLLALVVIGCWPMIPRSDLLLTNAVLVGLLGGAYGLLVPHVTRSLIAPILMMLVGLGLIVSCWGLYSKTRATDFWSRKVWLWWYLYDESRVCPRAGQGNANHAQGVSVLGTASALGLAWAWSRWWLLAVPILWIALVVCRDPRTGWLSQGVVHTGTAIVASAMVWLRGVAQSDWAVWALPVVVGSVGIWYVRPWSSHLPTTFDSGRIRLWRETLRDLWWPQSWVVQMIGFGTGSWRRLTHPFTKPRFENVVFTSAHNEYVEMLFQYGIVGLLVLLACLGDYLWRAWQGGPWGEALFIVELTLCSIAFTNFPWTFFHACAEERPFAYTVTGKHHEKGDGLFVATRKALAFRAYDDMQAMGAATPTLTAWFAQQPPAMLLEEHRDLDIDHDPPRHAGSPSLVTISFVLAVIGMAV